MNRFCLLLILLCAVLAISAAGVIPQMTVSYVAAEKIVDDSVTRVQLQLCGRPHTAFRIDSVLVHHRGMVRKAVDIDGVDFERWFQWEDTPVIDVELDLPGLDYNQSDTLIFYGPRGIVYSVLKKE